MARARNVPPIVHAPCHKGAIKPCVTMTEVAIHTITLAEGSFAAIVASTPEGPTGSIQFLDRDEVEAHITLLRNAMEDAERLDQGLPPIHSTQGRGDN